MLYRLTKHNSKTERPSKKPSESGNLFQCHPERSIITVSSVLLFLCLIALPSSLLAGMPGALPEDIETYFRLNEEPRQRVQAISFFLAGLVVSSVAVKFLWNALAKDFVWLPKLSFAKSSALVVLWGLLFVLVLTMISGARELMTPGAWKKSGITYELESKRDEAQAD